MCVYIYGLITFKILVFVSSLGSIVIYYCFFYGVTVLFTIITIITTIMIKYIIHQFSLLLVPSSFYISSYLCINFLLISNLISIL